MKVYLVYSHSKEIALGIFDSIDKAQKHAWSFPTERICIYEYVLNDTKGIQNLVFDNFVFKF